MEIILNGICCLHGYINYNRLECHSDSWTFPTVIAYIRFSSDVIFDDSKKYVISKRWNLCPDYWHSLIGHTSMELELEFIIYYSFNKNSFDIDISPTFSYNILSPSISEYIYID